MKEIGVVSWKLPQSEMSRQHFLEISPKYLNDKSIDDINYILIYHSTEQNISSFLTDNNKPYIRTFYK